MSDVTGPTAIVLKQGSWVNKVVPTLDYTGKKIIHKQIPRICLNGMKSLYFFYPVPVVISYYCQESASINLRNAAVATQSYIYTTGASLWIKGDSKKTHYKKELAWLRHARLAERCVTVPLLFRVCLFQGAIWNDPSV